MIRLTPRCLIATLVLAAAGNAAAYTEPFLTSVNTFAYGGTVGVPGSWTILRNEGPGTQTAETGTRWWDCESACAFGPGAALGWGYAQGNASTGTLRAAAGGRNMANSVSEWDVVSPFGTFHIVLPRWGEAFVETYQRSVWRIASPDGTLAIGDPVQVTASFQLDGLLDNAPDASFGAGLLLNRHEDATWISSRESIKLDFVYDIIGRGQSIGYVLRDGNTTGPVSLNESYTGTFHVGDLIVLETMLDVDAGAPNDGNPKEVWARFDQTMQSALQLQTPGAILVAVPEPQTWALMAAGVGVLALVGRRRRPREGLTSSRGHDGGPAGG